MYLDRSTPVQLSYVLVIAEATDYHPTETVTAVAVAIGIAKLSSPIGIASTSMHTAAPIVIRAQSSSIKYPIIQAVTKHPRQPANDVPLASMGDLIDWPIQAAMGSAQDKHKREYRAVFMSKNAAVTAIPAKK